MKWKNIYALAYVHLCAKAYLKYCLEQTESSKDFDDSDIGYVYMKK